MRDDERVSMFNRAQARDMEEKRRVEKAQERSYVVCKDDDVQVFTVRLPKLLHAALVQERLRTGDSLNTIIVRTLSERYPEDCVYMKMARMSLGLDE